MNNNRLWLIIWKWILILFSLQKRRSRYFSPLLIVSRNLHSIFFLQPSKKCIFFFFFVLSYVCCCMENGEVRIFLKEKPFYNIYISLRLSHPRTDAFYFMSIRALLIVSLLLYTFFSVLQMKQSTDVEK